MIGTSTGFEVARPFFKRNKQFCYFSISMDDEEKDTAGYEFKPDHPKEVVALRPKSCLFGMLRSNL